MRAFIFCLLALFINGAKAETVHFPTYDPCLEQSHTYTPVSITAATNTQVITGATGKKIYICSIVLVAGTADNVGIVEGSGSVCATNTAGVIGGATATNGVNAAANGGFAMGGQMAVAATATSGDNLCLFPSSAGPLSGHIVSVQQ